MKLHWASLGITAGLAAIAVSYALLTTPVRPGIIFEFGGCEWVPPSAVAADTFVRYFWGLDPSITADDYEAVLANQMLAAGWTPGQVKRALRYLHKCLRDYVVPKKDRS